jgi:acyl carrier protein
MKTRDKVYACITQQLGEVTTPEGERGQEDQRQLKPTDRLEEDLGMDSLDSVELGMLLEEAFGVELPEDTTEDWTNVGDVVTAVEKAVGPTTR